jgi:hypothetical protein
MTLDQLLKIATDLNSPDPYVSHLAEEAADRIERELCPQVVRESWTEQCSEG